MISISVYLDFGLSPVQDEDVHVKRKHQLSESSIEFTFLKVCLA